MLYNGVCMAKKKTRKRRTINGEWEVVDRETGDVLSVQYADRTEKAIQAGKKVYHRFNGRELLELFTKDGDKVYCPKESIRTVLDYKDREVQAVWA